MHTGTCVDMAKSVALLKKKKKNKWTMDEQAKTLYATNKYVLSLLLFCLCKILGYRQFKEKYMELMFLCVSASMCAYNE